jgi:hypothetical protein
MAIRSLSQACVTLAGVANGHPVCADGCHGQNARAVAIADADRILAESLGTEAQKTVNLTRGDLLTGVVDQSPAPIPSDAPGLNARRVHSDTAHGLDRVDQQ